MDEWAFIPYLKEFNEGKLDYFALLKWQYNNHKIFVPLLWLFSLARLTYYNGAIIQFFLFWIDGMCKCIDTISNAGQRLSTTVWQNSIGHHAFFLA